MYNPDTQPQSFDGWLVYSFDATNQNAAWQNKKLLSAAASKCIHRNDDIHVFCQNPSITVRLPMTTAPPRCSFSKQQLRNVFLYRENLTSWSFLGLNRSNFYEP